MKHLTYRGKIFLSLVVVALIPTLLLAGLSYHITRNSLRQRSISEAGEAANVAAVKVSARLALFGKALAYVANDTNLTAIAQQNEMDYFEKYVVLTKTIQPLLNTVVFLTDNMESMTVYTLNPILIDKAAYIKSLDEIAAEPWYARALSGRTLTWTIEGETLIGAYRIYTPVHDTPPSMLVGKMNAASLLDETWIGMQPAIFALESADHTRLYAAGGDNERLLQACPAQGGSFLFENRAYVSVSIPVNDVGWNLVLIVPDSPIGIDPEGFLQMVIWFTAGCLMVIVLITALLSKMLTRRVRALYESVRRIEHGDTDARTYAPGNDELSQISRSYDRMLEEINRLVEQVYLEKLERKEADLRTLRAQINPHFLYNTLALIRNMAQEAGNSAIGDVAVNLAEFYRTMLNRGDESILLRDEIRNIRAYVDIQRVAHDNSFDAVYDVDESLENCRVINMLLQPLVENAIVHGVDELKGERGWVRVSAAGRGDRLLLIVEDNGPGITPDVAKTIFTGQTDSYGIRNVCQRIRLQFGDAYGLAYDFSVLCGARAIITLPWIKNTK